MLGEAFANWQTMRPPRSKKELRAPRRTSSIEFVRRFCAKS